MMTAQETLIRKTPGVVGGDACIRRTRIAVWMLMEMKRDGASDMEILSDYPHLTLADLAAAWDYYSVNKEEIDETILANEAA